MSYKTHSNSWPVNVIIMSGGKGTRLKLLTENKHKSLIEVGEKSVIVHLIEHLTLFGLHNVYISVGHLSEQIINSIEDGSKLDASIKYIHESIPMGSISSLSLEQNWEHEHFLILNGDIFTNFNLNHFISTYFSKKVDMAILTSQNVIEVPWCVLDTTSTGEIVSLTEKPKYSVQISAGVYLFNRRVLKLLPPFGPMEGWELIQCAINSGCTLISVPLNGSYWIDIGTVETLAKAQKMVIATNID